MITNPDPGPPIYITFLLTLNFLMCMDGRLVDVVLCSVCVRDIPLFWNKKGNYVVQPDIQLVHITHSINNLYLEFILETWKRVSSTCILGLVCRGAVDMVSLNSFEIEVNGENVSYMKNPYTISCNVYASH